MCVLRQWEGVSLWGYAAVEMKMNRMKLPQYPKHEDCKKTAMRLNLWCF